MGKSNQVILYQPRYAPADSSIKPIAPLALLFLADALDRAGFDAVILDEQVEERALDTLRSLAKAALCFGVTSMSGYQIQGALAAAAVARETRADLPIIWGGWHPSLLPEQTAQHALVDIVVRGPGEITLVELLRRMISNQSWEGVAGITYRRDGKVVSEADRPIAAPNPARRLPFAKLRMDRYGGRKMAGDDYGTILSCEGGHPFPYISSCGCPFRCRFCAATKVYQRKWFSLPVEKTLDELETLHKQYGIKVFYFVDPEFFIDANRAETIMQGIVDRGLKIIWKAQVRPDHIVKLGMDRMRLAYQSGCRQLEIGQESGSPEMLEMIQKDSATASALESAIIIKESGIIGQYNMMFGFPHETDRHIRESMMFVAKLKRANPECLIPMFFFAPHPGIPLLKDAEECGYKPPASLAEWSQATCSYSEPVMPWIRRPRRIKDWIWRVITFYIPLAYPGEVTRGTLRHVRSRMRRMPEALWMWPAHWAARFRVTLGFYGLPFEWRIFRWFQR